MANLADALSVTLWVPPRYRWVPRRPLGADELDGCSLFMSVFFCVILGVCAVQSDAWSYVLWVCVVLVIVTYIIVDVAGVYVSCGLRLVGVFGGCA